MERFTETELATIRKFIDWMKEEGHIDSSTGVTGINDDGVVVTAFDAVDDYGGYTLERTESYVPPRAMTDPDAYAAECAAAEAQREVEQQAIWVAELSRRQEQERATYEALKAKYG